jgi:hypothetical protein
VEYAATAAWRGHGILLERPIAGDLAGAEEIAAAVATKRVVSLLVLPWRHATEVRRFLADEAPNARRRRAVSDASSVARR